jgi:tetratricopeptide (TPR) repeat protein
MRTLENAPDAVASIIRPVHLALQELGQREVDGHERSAIFAALQLATASLTTLIDATDTIAIGNHARVARAEVAMQYLKYLSGAEARALIEQNALNIEQILAELDKDTSLAATTLGLYADAMADFVSISGGSEKERRLGIAIDAMQASELFPENGSSPTRAADRAVMTRIFSEYYGADRDVAINRAVRYGWEAISMMLPDPTSFTIDLPATYLVLGNSLSKLGWDRAGSLRQSKQAYELGLEVCDATATPDLYRTLSNNFAWVQELIDTTNIELPESENADRFTAAIQRQLDQGDMDGGIRMCKRALGWSWTLQPAPNVRTATFHGLMAQLLEAQSVEAAMAHRRAELAISYANAESSAFQGAIAHCLAELDAALKRTGFAGRDAVLTGADTCIRDAVIPFQDGWEKLARGEAIEAADDFQRALAAYPFHPYSLYGLGAGKTHTGHLAEAQALLNEALTYIPDMPDARLYRAQIFAQENQLDLAIEDLDVVLKTQPDNSVALELKAQYLTQVES